MLLARDFSLYVMGQARERSDIVAAEIAYDSSAPMFLISTRTEAQVSSGLRWGFWGWGIFGLLLCLGAFIGRDAALNRESGSRWLLYFLASVGYFAAWTLGWAWMVQVVPDRFVAALGGLPSQALMAANDFERAPVEVSLSSGPATS